jgi:outer membrane protein assembly factor BamB
MNHQAILVLSALSLATVGLRAAIDNWPQFRGPNGSGLAASATPPTDFGPDRNLRWKSPAPAGLSSPIVWGDHLFLTAVVGKDLVTLAYDARTGRELWRRAVTPGKLESVHKFSSAAAATPCTDGRHVFAYFNSFGVVAYDFEGREAWRHALPMLPVQWGSASSPVLAGGRLVIQRDCRTAASHLLALDPQTGEKVWNLERPFARSSHSTPMLWRHDGREELMVLGAGRLTAYDPATGKEQWWVRGWGKGATATLVAGEGLLFAGSKSGGDPDEPPRQEMTWDHLIKHHDANQDGALQHAEIPADFAIHLRPEVPKETPGNFVAVRVLLKNFVDPNKDGTTTKEEWDAESASWSDKANADRLVALRPGARDDATTTHVVWETMKGLPELPSPLFFSGRIYLIADGGRLTVLSAATGKRALDREPIGVGGQYVASPIAANDLIYVASEPGEITVLRAGDSIDVVAKSSLAESIRATPAIVGRSLFVRTGEHLWAFGE